MMSTVSPINQIQSLYSAEAFTQAAKKIELLQKRIQKLVVEGLSSQDCDESEKEKIRKYVSTIPFDKLPLVSIDHLVPPDIFDFFHQIRVQWCLDDKSYLDHLWSVELYMQFNKLIALDEGKGQFLSMRNEFAAVSIRYSHLYTQITIESMLRNGELLAPIKNSNVKLGDGTEGTLYTVSDRLWYLKANMTNLIALRNRVEATRKKALESKKNDVETKQKRNLLKKIVVGLDCGGVLWSDPYCYRYFQEAPLGKVLLKSVQNKNLEENRQQLNTYFEMISTSWKVAHERRWLVTFPEILDSPLTIPPLKDINNADILKLRTRLINEIIIILPKMLYLQSLLFTQQTVPWKVLTSQLGWKVVDQGETPPMTLGWLLDANGCLLRTFHDLMAMRRLTENVICKYLLKDFCPFEELCSRLLNNFMKVFGTDKNEEVVKVENAFKGGITTLFNKFEKNLSFIADQFEKKTKAHLPPLKEIEIIKKHLLLMREFLGDNNVPPVLEMTLRSFRKAVIFAANKIPTAITKAKIQLFNSLEHSLKSISAGELEEQKELLIEKLEALCFTKLKSFLDLLVTLRDIQAVLLIPEEGTEALEKGLHLIPDEFSSLLEPKEIAWLIEAHIKSQFTPEVNLDEEKEYIVEVENVIDEFSSEGTFESERIPPLRNTTHSELIEIVSQMNDTSSFKVPKGEKIRKVMRRLALLGVYTVRFEGGSHRILGHANTKKPFPLPMHDEISQKVAGTLEEWVNSQILKKI